ncbi:helix-turn-helix transcriptional regulator [Chitinilyticum litopenaei]|uniref:Helix-turn-helix transcriptional regulator n=2 Tax=Chitinilyticum piscinae TaxID=2866724 RepID=A0A8J7FGV6_9NEIS|nr:helix-turn-helix transcriptional regulator [Chitinilyticum piscinae]
MACAGDCPVARTARLIEGKWTTRIIRDLLGGTKRYSELQHSLAGISPKVLADRLKFLEREGLLSKTVYPVVPPHTDYTLTPLGMQLADLIAAMAAFGMRLPPAGAAPRNP